MGYLGREGVRGARRVDEALDNGVLDIGVVVGEPEAMRAFVEFLARARPALATRPPPMTTSNLMSFGSRDRCTRLSAPALEFGGDGRRRR